jgi:hypothetical protein
VLLLKRDGFDPSRYRIGQLVAKNSAGDLNSVFDLRNYVVGLSHKGLVLSSDGALDLTQSFARVDYFTLLRGLHARNNLQRSVSSQPVDFIAMPVPTEALIAALPESAFRIDNAIWLFRDEERQALILGRRQEGGPLLLRYFPIRRLTQDSSGQIRFVSASWEERLPLELWEDLPMPPEQRRVWLETWHTEAEWLRAIHMTRYSNALIGLYEEFSFWANRPLSASAPLTDDDLIVRFRERKRRLAQPDFIVFANDHWNFNYRGFNPGGNHGAFFRPSTHATLMFAGGRATRIPQGLEVAEPYDALSFAPTIFFLTGGISEAGLSAKLVEKGFKPFPGPVIRELFDTPSR